MTSLEASIKTLSKKSKTVLSSVYTAFLLALPLLTLSQISNASELYLNGGVGTADAEYGNFDADDTYYRIGGGVAVSDITYIEGGLWDMGTARTQGVSISADGLYGAVRIGTDIGNNIQLFGRLGAYLWDVDGSIGDDDGLDIFFGGGLSFDVGPGTLDAEIHLMELDRVDVTTFGVAYTLPIEF